MEKFTLWIVYITVIIVAALIAFLLIRVNSARNTAKYESNGYVIENVHVIVGNGEEERNKNVVIQNGKIAQITDDSVSNANSVVIDGTGKTLMPGLIDAHMHVMFSCKSEKESDDFLKIKAPILLKNLLENGVTTIKDLTGAEYFIFILRDEIKNKEIVAPDLLIVGPSITAKDGHPTVGMLTDNNPWMREQFAKEVTTAEQAKEVVRRLAEKKVDFIKVVYHGGEYVEAQKGLFIQKLDINIIKAVIAEAKKYNLKVTAHTNFEDDVIELLEAGIYGIEHGAAGDTIKTEKISELFKQNETYYVPTLTIFSYGINTNAFEIVKHNFKILCDKGVKIACGTDMMLEGMPATSIHRELALYVESGMSTMDALVTATHNSAEYLGILDRKGTVEEGKDADLILLNNDPLDDINNISNINAVFKLGEMVYSNKPKPEDEVKLRDFAFPTDGLIQYDDKMTLSDPLGRVYDLESFKKDGTIKVDYVLDGKSIIQESVKVKADLDTLEWRYSKPGDNTELNATTQDGVIRLTGMYKGKDVNSKLKQGAKKWFQLSPLECSFAKSDVDELNFIYITTDGPASLKATEFESKKEGTETIEVDGVAYKCIKTSTVITVIPTMWTAYKWFDQQTGLCVKYLVKGYETKSFTINNAN